MPVVYKSVRCKYELSSQNTLRNVKQKPARADSDDDWDWLSDPDDLSGVIHPTVVCEEEHEVFTGLLDSSGNAIIKVVAPNPIGFHAKFE